MVAARITNFGGMLPAIDSRLLPDNQAAYSRNSWVYSGILQGLHAPTLVRTLTNPDARVVFRIPESFSDYEHLSAATWMEFENPDTIVLRAPVVGDTYNRYYWCSPVEQASYNTLARIQAGSAAYLLGIPTPSADITTISPASGVSSTNVTRVYVYTYVSAYGEEGPPSDTYTITGKTDDTYTVTLPSAPGGDTANRNLTERRLYRTVTSASGVATYYLVTTLPIATTSYADALADGVVTLNGELESTLWTAPPTDLEGWAAMPNGIFVGWRGKELWFSEPYRPHAWPTTYTIAVDFEIVALGVFGQTVVVTTTGNPAAVSGVNPASMSLTKISTNEPCVSRGSVISTPDGVYYASQNGLVIANASGIRNITREIITKEKWQEFSKIATLRAARLGTAYFAFGSARDGVFETTAFEETMVEQEDFTGAYGGIIIDPQDKRFGFHLLSHTATPTFNTFNDPWSGELFLIRSGGVYWIDQSENAAAQEEVLWRSKQFLFNAPVNMSALQVQFDVPPNAPALNPVPNTALVQTLASDQYGLARVYAEGVHIFTRELRESGEIMRLPIGVKSRTWQVELETRVDIVVVHLAQTVKELAGG